MPSPKLIRYDTEAVSSSQAAVEPWRSARARNRGALSRSGGNRALQRFSELHEQLWPTRKKLHEEEIAHHATKEAVAAGKEGAAERLKAAKADYELAYTLYRSVSEHFLNMKP